jgi:hypothetical protein
VPIDWVMPSERHAARYAPAVYCLSSRGHRNTALLAGV